MGDQAQRRMMKGVDDLDFFIGDEAIDKPTYATKVSVAQTMAYCLPLFKSHITHNPFGLMNTCPLLFLHKPVCVCLWYMCVCVARMHALFSLFTFLWTVYLSLRVAVCLFVYLDIYLFYGTTPWGTTG